MRKAIVGLGNPGARYSDTRHNVGFMVIDRLASKLRATLGERSLGGVWGRCSVGEDEVILAKPETFMNLSGDMVAALIEVEAIEPNTLLVVHDELDLPLGRVQVKRGGGSAGHRGVQSIIDRLGQNDFPRVRIGVGKPSPDGEAVDFVLGRFASDEREQLEDVLGRAAAAAETWLVSGIDIAMSRCNVRPRPA